MKNDFNKDQYESNSQLYLEHNSKGEAGGNSPVERVNLLKKYLPKGKQVFEIGSGGGMDAEVLRNEGYKVIASDFVDNFLAILKEKGFDILKFDAKSDELPSDTSAIYANAVFVHLSPENISSLLQRANKSLINEKLIFATVLKGDGYERSARAKGFERDFYYYNLNTLSKLFTDNGCEIIFSDDNDPKWLTMIGRIHSKYML